MFLYHEQRRHERFKPVDRSAFVVFGPEFRKIGPIRDTSREGLGFSHLSQPNATTSATDSTYFTDIISSGDSFSLTNIPCTPVYDSPADDNTLTFKPDPVNGIFGLKFGSLTEFQMKQFTHFPVKYTVAKSS